VMVTVTSPQCRPRPPALTATPGNALINLSWSSSSGATSYNVRRATVAGGPYAALGTVSLQRRTPIWNLTNGTTYYYVVSADEHSGAEPQTPTKPTLHLAPAASAVIAIAGDMACDPADANYNGGLGMGTSCQEIYLRLAADPSIVAVLTVGDLQYNDGTLSAFQASYDPTWAG